MWRTPEELMAIGFARSRVVMMNEAHNGLMRCIRTREIGRRILPTAHSVGVRYLAMEALFLPSLAEESNHTRKAPEMQDGGYLAQPEMRAFIQAALNLGWTLVSYEADMDQLPPAIAQKGFMSQEEANWREEIQAQNLVSALNSLAPDAKILVWCGNGHHTKEIIDSKFVMEDGKLVPKPADEPAWIPMGYLFKQLSGIDPFVIDQIITVRFPAWNAAGNIEQMLNSLAPQLEARGGTAGFLKDEAPDLNAERFNHRSSDAFLLSIQNDLE